jgi:hypothetical protein
MANTKNQDDDLPEGLRQSSSVNYSPGKPHQEVAAPVKSVPIATAKSEYVIPAEVQAKRDEEAIRIWQDELYKARDRLAAGDERARGDIHALENQIKRATGEMPSLSVDTESTGNAESDVAPSLKDASVVNYGTPNVVQNPSIVSNKTKAEMGIGALVGAATGYRQRKAEAKTTQQNMENLPPEMRPVDSTSLQRYINSQLKHSVPLEDLKKLTGVDIRTLKEAQAAIRVIQGSEMERTPVIKDVNGQKVVVSHRITPAQAPIDISMYEPQSNSILSKIGNQIAEKTKSLASGAMNYFRPVAGGMVAAPQLMEAGSNYFQNKPVDPTQVISGLGGIGMMTKSTPLGAAGALAQLPYAIKHREEMMKNMNLSDLVPDAIKIGMTGAELYEPALPNMPPLSTTSGVK